jgi:hypothetical protein
VYDRAGKLDKAADCYTRELTILEKQYGPDNPLLIQILTSEANALRSLGRKEEVEKIEQRIKTLQTSAANQN